jgi:ADP-heptose:LPS heptosyltransferase
MRGYRYDLGIDPRGDFLVALVLWLARIPRRIGWAAGGGGFLLTDTTTWVPQRHEIDSRLALVRILGGARGDFEPELYPNWADSYAVREALAALPNPQLPVVVLHHGAGTAAKRWPLENWSELLQRLGHETAATVILVGDSTDQARARQLARGQHRVVDWTGRLTLMQLAALLGEADLFIGGDSGPAHVAAAMGTPTVVLFSGTNRAECWRPFGSRTQILCWPVRCSPCHLKTCPVPGHLCMSGIRPSAVLEAVRQIIASIGCATGDRALSHAQPEP